MGVAERNILFTGFTGTTLQTAYGGGIDLWAKTGDVNLIDRSTGVSGTGALSTIRTQGGGGISIKTGQDLIASMGFDESRRRRACLMLGNQHRWPRSTQFGCRKRFHRRGCGRHADGPGFVLWNTDLTVNPQHTVTVGGKIGETNLTLGPNGLPLTAVELRAQNKPLETESSARYADFALSGGELTVTAGGNIYLGRVRDAGLVGGMDAQQPTRPSLRRWLENNKATFVSRDGNIIINTNSLDAGRQGSPLEVLSTLLPPRSKPRADKGTIQIRSNLDISPLTDGSGEVFRASGHSGRAKNRPGR